MKLREPAVVCVRASALIGKGGWPEAMKLTTPCPSCGHLNEAKRTSCSVCESALIGKGGRPVVKSTTPPCPSCDQTNCSDCISCPCQERNSAEILLVIIIVNLSNNVYSALELHWSYAILLSY